MHVTSHGDYFPFWFAWHAMVSPYDDPLDIAVESIIVMIISARASVVDVVMSAVALSLSRIGGRRTR